MLVYVDIMFDDVEVVLVNVVFAVVLDDEELVVILAVVDFSDFFTC